MPDSEQPDLTRLTVDLLSAYFANNSVPSSELAALIDQTRSALAGESPSGGKAEVHKPAVSVEDSLASKEHILSLIDGKPYKSLKRHLANNGLTPAEYRSRYDLAADYPMVAPAYSEHRRAVAQRMGLGGRPGAAKGSAAKSSPSLPAGSSTSDAKADAAKPVPEEQPEAKAELAAAPKSPAAKAKSSPAGKGVDNASSSTEKPADAPRGGKKRFARQPQAAAAPAKPEPSTATETPSQTATAAPKARSSASPKPKSAKPAKAAAPATKSQDAASPADPTATATDSVKKPTTAKPKSRKSAGPAKASKSTGARTNTASAGGKGEPS